MTGTTDLRRQVADGVRRLFQNPSLVPEVDVEGSWPQIDLLKVSLSGLQLDQQRPPPTPRSPVAPILKSEDLAVGQLLVNASPLHLGDGADAQFEAEAEEVILRQVRDADDRLWLIPHSISASRVSLRIGAGELERLLLALARQAASRHGVQIDAVHLDLRQAQERELALEATLDARKMFVKSRLVLRGRAMIAPDLSLRLADLQCTGNGMIANLACQFLNPHLAAWENRPLQLLASALPVRLNQVTLNTEPDRRFILRADFTAAEEQAPPRQSP